MSLTQTSINQFFKVKRNSNHPLGKDGKQIPLKRGGKSLSIEKTECKQEDASKGVDLTSLLPDVSIKDNSAAKTSLSSQSTVISEEIVAEKTNCIKKDSVLEKSEQTDICEVRSGEISTPKRKIEESEGPLRKRKRQQINELWENEESSVTSSEEEGEQETKTRQAKRRLVLGRKPTEAKKKLDPQTIKEQLGKCGRLDELRAKLLKLNECEKKLNAFKSKSFRKECLAPPPPPSPRKQMSLRESIKCSSAIASKSSRVSPYNSPLKDKRTLSPQLKSFTSLDIEVPLSPSKSPLAVRTPVKSSSERFSHLAEPSSKQLSLPHGYQVVKEVFRAVDTIVSLLHNRQEVITYSKLKPAVQEMLRKTFSESHLGQLKTVFPLAYFFNQEKIKNSYNTLTSSFQLTVKPNLEYKKEHSVSRNLMQELEGTDGATKKTQPYRKMGPAVLVERRDIFHSALLDILKVHHNKFLETLDPPIVLKGPIYRWHPEFPLEDISAPPPSSLPQPPSSDLPQTAKGVLDKAKDTFSVNNRMQKALETISSATKSESSSSSAADNKQVATALKGISLSLLEKIRAREATKAAREMTRNSGDSKELVMLSRLPELVRILRSMFVTEKKAALPWEAVMLKIIGSHSGSLSTSEADSHVKLLMKELPGWCTSHNVRSGLYLKIDQARQLNEITEKLNGIIKERT